MSKPYREMLGGVYVLRQPPGVRHEQICGRLHQLVELSLAEQSGARQLPPRTPLQISPGNLVCPDLALVTAANDRLWLAAEIVNPQDHAADTVTKKQLYEDCRLPRLWVIDPRYDNIEVYHASPYGLVLKEILAGREALSESLLPQLRLTVANLFEGR
jgi:Uma2 family endonuclease